LGIREEVGWGHWAPKRRKIIYLHSSVDSCCEAIFPEMSCPLEDVCLGGEDSTVHVPKEESSCQDQKWHPSTDFKTCTNSKVRLFH
jgi:hypothetical protein